MSSRNRDGGVDDATKSALKDEDANLTGKRTSFVDQLLNEARETGHVIGEPNRTQEADTEDDVEDQQAETVADETETETEQTDEQEQSEETTEESEEAEKEGDEQKVAAERKSIDEQIKELEEKGEEVPWFLSRIADQTDKIHKRTTERDSAVDAARGWQQRAEAAEAQLANGSAPVAVGSDPTATVFNPQGLQQLDKECDRWIAWCDENPDGGEAVLGKDDKGDKITRSLSPEAVKNLRRNCDITQRKLIPKREGYLKEFSKLNETAAEIYPELKDPKSAFRQEAEQMLYAIVNGRIPPDAIIWIAHAIKQRNDYVARNGKAKAKTSTQSDTKKIVQSAKTKLAPSTVRGSGAMPRPNSANADKARKNLQEKGDADSAEAWLEAQGVGGRRYQKSELVQR